MRRVRGGFIVSFFGLGVSTDRLEAGLFERRRPLCDVPCSLSDNDIRCFLYQLLLAVARLHSHGVIHRDLKPANLLVDTQNKILKVCDFGAAMILLQGIDLSKFGTRWYESPEYLLGSTDHSTPVDLWAVGCIFAEMGTGAPLFQGSDESDQISRIFRLLGNPTEEDWPGVTSLPNWQEHPRHGPQPLNSIGISFQPDASDLLLKLLSCNPAKRMTAFEAIQHPFFDELNKSAFEEHTDDAQ